MMRTAPIKKLRASLGSQGIRIYLNECGAVRIETNHYRREMRPEEFLALLQQKQRNDQPKPKGDFS